MKKYLFICALFLSLATQAQKFGYVDSEAILQKMPEYAEAQKQLDEFSANMQKRIDMQFAEINDKPGAGDVRQLYGDHSDNLVAIVEKNLTKNNR